MAPEKFSKAKLAHSMPRSESFGQNRPLSFVDRFGIWLSTRKIRSLRPTLAGSVVADVGCGYNALLIRAILDDLHHAFIIDVKLADDLKCHDKITAIEAGLPEALRSVPDATVDLLICNNVVEHLWEPLATLRELYRVSAPGGIVFVNVPSWRGKWFLEFFAFRLGLSPAFEMNDHKMYYDPKDLWPLLVRAGFLPQSIRLGTHKFGLNTYAICRA